MATTTTTKYSTFINTLAGKDLCTLRLKIKHFLKPSKWLWSTACEQSAWQPHRLKAGHMPRIRRTLHAQSNLRFMNVHTYLLDKTGIIIIILIFQVEIQLGLTYSQQGSHWHLFASPRAVTLKVCRGDSKKGGPCGPSSSPTASLPPGVLLHFSPPLPFPPKATEDWRL